jgi:hypothetical protein
MTHWFKHVGRAIGLGFAWAVVWAPVAVLIGTTIVDPDNSMDEMWVAVGAYPAFLSAVVFFGMVATAERRRRFDELSLARAAAWGALAGILVGVVPFTIGTPTSSVPLWQLGLAAIGSIALMSMLSAVVSVLLARMARKRQLRGAPAHMA